MAQIIRNKNSFTIRILKDRDSQGNRRLINHKIKFSDLTATTPKAMEKEVKKIADSLEKQVKDGEYYEGNTMTFRDFEKVWLEEWATTNIAQRQIENYEHYIKTKAFPYIGNLLIEKIKPLHIQKIINDMVKNDYSPKTIRTMFVAVNSVFRYAYNMSIITENPCNRCQLPKLNNTNTELHYFTVEQAQTFLNALTLTYTVNHKEHNRKNVNTAAAEPVKNFTQSLKIPFQWRVYFTLAIYGGFRRGELIALTWNDIDFINQTISINKAIANTKKYGEIVKEPKTESGRREIVLPQICFDLLAEWYEQEKELCKTLGTAWKGKSLRQFDNTWIFITADGDRMFVDSPTKRFRTILEMYNSMIDEQVKECTDDNERELLNASKLPIIRLHDLRHTSATLLIAEGVDIETVSHRLGHSRASVTLDVYAHAMKHKDTEAADTLSKIFSSAAEKAKKQPLQKPVLN